MIEALTKEQDERKAVAENMTVRLDVPMAVPPKRRPLQDKYAYLIERFYVIAERKVSLRDEYGDENWDVLDKEISTVIKRLPGGKGFINSPCPMLAAFQRSFYPYMGLYWIVWEEFLAVDAVRGELVSARNSLVSGNCAGNFYAQEPRVAAKIPGNTGV